MIITNIGVKKFSSLFFPPSDTLFVFDHLTCPVFDTQPSVVVFTFPVPVSGISRIVQFGV